MFECTDIGVSGISYGHFRSSTHRIFLMNLLHLNRAGPPLLIGVLNGILLLRVFALYDRSKRGMFHQYICLCHLKAHRSSARHPAHSQRR
jgi:hypothetical protein